MRPYERYYRCCPYCGWFPEPIERSAPHFVDGDLELLSPEVLAALRGEVSRVDAPVQIPHALSGTPAEGALRRNHWQRQQNQRDLRSVMAWWAGVHTGSQSESERKFFHRFGVDVASALALNAADAEALTTRIRGYLASVGVDCSQDAFTWAASQQ